MRQPDGCWVERLATLTKEQQEKFLPIAPDFIVEIRSRTDSLSALNPDSYRDKMLEWIDNGVRLGWLIDAKNEQVFIYRENGSIEIIKGFDKSLSGEEVMPKFEFDLSLLKY